MPRTFGTVFAIGRCAVCTKYELQLWSIPNITRKKKQGKNKRQQERNICATSPSSATVLPAKHLSAPLDVLVAFARKAVSIPSGMGLGQAWCMAPPSLMYGHRGRGVKVEGEVTANYVFQHKRIQ